MTTPMYNAGCFPHPITREELSEYGAMADQVSPPVAEVMRKLILMVDAWLDATPSVETAQPHPSHPGVASIVPLSEAEKSRLFDLIPWPYEIKAWRDMAREEIAAGSKSLQKAFWHLIWYAMELTNDREPITKDKLKPKS